MHIHMLEKATPEQIKAFASEFITMLKEKDHDMYECAEHILYKTIYGCHFTDWSLEKALACMQNEDGTTGRHWTIEQTTEYAKQHDIHFKHFNEYDWNYVMNMVYSDYYGIISDDIKEYVKFAKRFIEDVDAPKGKAFIYYEAMKDAE